MKNTTREYILSVLDAQRACISNFPMGSNARYVQEAYYKGHYAMAEEILTEGFEFEKNILLRWNDFTHCHEIIENGEVFVYGD